MSSSNKDELIDKLTKLSLSPVISVVPKLPKLNIVNKYKLAEFFCGTGSFSLGFESTGKFETIYANDIDPNSKKIFDLNFKIPLILDDIHNLDISRIPKMDIITAGISCQPFSIAGNKLGFADERSDVFWTLVKIIEFHKPKIFLIENVKNLVSHDNGNSMKLICDNLKNLGYHIKYEVLNTCKIVTTPQNRERVFIIGFLDFLQCEKFRFPESNVYKNTNISDLLESKVNKKYYYDQRFKCWPLIESSVIKNISTNTIYQYRRTIVRENKSSVCPTLTANAGTGGHNVPIIKDDIGIRKLTPLECFRLQGFPESYKFGNLNDNALYKLAGNAVSTPVIQKIVEQIILVL